MPLMHKYKLIVLWIACASPSAADDINQRLDSFNQRLDSLFGKHAEYQEFHNRLVEAVGRDDRAALANMVHYPLRRNHNGITTEYHTQADFIKDYPIIFNEAVRAAVLGQDFSELFANYAGIMYGRGELWVSELCVDYSPRDTTCNTWGAVKIYTINTP